MSPSERLFFDAQGYLVLENALAGPLYDQVLAAAERAERKWRSDASLPGVRSEVLDSVQCPIEYDPVLRDLLWHPPVFDRVRDAIGDDIQMIDNDLFITPPRTPRTHSGWHHDVGMRGIKHAESVLMVKAFYLLTDVLPESGGTALIPGSHRFPADYIYPSADEPMSMPGAVQMTGPAGTAYIFNGRIYHCAVNNSSTRPRRVLIYNYGRLWMKMWAGYEPSESLLKWARESGDPRHLQVLGIGDPYTGSL